MFTLNVRKLSRKKSSSRQTARPQRRKVRPTFKPKLVILEDRCCPSGGVPDIPTSTALFWDPPSGNNANIASNWDKGSLGSGQHPINPPGNNANELDSIYFDGSTLASNSPCTWNYLPQNDLGAVTFQNHWNQTLAFQSSRQFSVIGGGEVKDTSAPTITPDGSRGLGSYAAIGLLNGSSFYVDTSASLFLQGYSSGNAVFMAGDGTAGECLSNGGTVVYLGVGSGNATANTDYLKVPVLNSGTFRVSGNGTGSSNAGSVLRVSGTDTKTNNVSFYQNTKGAETDIYGNGTLWCYNNYTMAYGKLQTLDSYSDTLKVGTSGDSPVDGTANLLSGTVNINPGANTYGTLQIVGTTNTNAPTVNLGSVTLNFKVNMNKGVIPSCDVLIVGKPSGSGKINFNNNGGTTTVAIDPQGAPTKGNAWQIIFFGSVDLNGKQLTLSPATGYTPNWSKPNLLEIDN